MLLNGEATNTNLIVFGLTNDLPRSRQEANHYDVVTIFSGDIH